MVSMKTHNILRIFTAALAVCLMVISALAQDDPDPNSPTPILLAGPDRTRVLAVPTRRIRLFDQGAASRQAFPPNSKITIYVRNVDLMEGEGANAFRVYAEDAKGRQFRFPILAFRVSDPEKSTYAVTIRLRDDIGYWQSPIPNGDLLIRIAWRGLTSDRLRLGYGSTGGHIKDDPIPFSSARTATSKFFNNEDAAESSRPGYVGYRWSGDRMRFLEQAAFGPTSALDSRIRRIGLRTWLHEQFEAPYPSLTNPYPNIPLKSTDAQNVTLGCGANNNTLEYRTCIRDHYTMYPAQAWFFKEAYYGEPQLRHRVSWALSQIWVISGVDTQQASWLIDYHQVLSEHTFGNFRNLMKDMTLNPGMGNYLDMARSTRNNPNENYAREILQLFAVGLFMLNPDGTLQLDGQGQPIPTYDQNTVNNFTKVFTGFSFCNTTCPNSAPGIVNYKDPLILNQNNHDITAKTLLSYPGAVNQNIAPGLNGNTEIDLALDNIFMHPNVGPFVGKLLIQHMVTSDPTPAYVGRVAAVFNNNGLGIRGDLKAVVRAILLDPEARGDVKTDPNFGKLREPVQFATNIFRTFNVKSANLAQNSDGVFYPQANNLLGTMGQSAFYSPTVFNYFSPDYVIPGTSLLGPEFGVMTTGTAIARANFVNTMVFAQISTSENVPLGTKLDFAEMQALAAADATGNQLLDALNQKMMHGAMSASMRSTILTAVTNIASTNPLARAQQAIYLVATSSQYQIQR